MIIGQDLKPQIMPSEDWLVVFNEKKDCWIITGIIMIKMYFVEKSEYFLELYTDRISPIRAASNDLNADRGSPLASEQPVITTRRSETNRSDSIGIYDKTRLELSSKDQIMEFFIKNDISRYKIRCQKINTFFLSSAEYSCKLCSYNCDWPDMCINHMKDIHCNLRKDTGAEIFIYFAYKLMRYP